MSDGEPTLAALQYGDVRGSPAARAAVATMITSFAGGQHTADPARIIFTNGSSLGLDMAAAALLKRGETVLCEQATYFLARKLVRP